MQSVQESTHSLIPCTRNLDQRMAIALNAATGDPELNWPDGWPSDNGVASGKISSKPTSDARGSEVLPFLLSWSGPQKVLLYTQEENIFHAAVAECPAVTDQ